MKKFVIGLVLVFLVLSSTTVIYANVSNNDDVYLNNPSDFYIAQETLVSEQNKTIIPLTQVRGLDDVHYVSYQYDVIVKEGYTLYAQIEDLGFTQGNLDTETLERLFNFDVTYETLSDGTYNKTLFSQAEDTETVRITVKVSMNEPQSKTIVYQLVGGSLTFETYFFVN
ncbi:MAG: hypothetical protein UMR38_08200 [Candidatus Izemoplasma sp.]|nr:hypothetical protein [Candidatus Izemoplasma sp.]